MKDYQAITLLFCVMPMFAAIALVLTKKSQGQETSLLFKTMTIGVLLWGITLLIRVFFQEGLSKDAVTNWGMMYLLIGSSFISIVNSDPGPAEKTSAKNETPPFPLPFRLALYTSVGITIISVLIARFASGDVASRALEIAAASTITFMVLGLSTPLFEKKVRSE
jgi:hypothetical protein